jgi:Protein of unknown function (DUF3147)
MIIKLSGSTVRETRWYEYLLRFLLGGLITAAAGVIAQQFGPIIGGLFLAFPAIFPASATLVEKHERQKKESKGLSGSQRGRDVAALEAMGSAIGSTGLLLFAALVWLLLSRHRPWLVLAVATCAWGIASAGVWQLRRKL